MKKSILLIAGLVIVAIFAGCVGPKETAAPPTTPAPTTPAPVVLTEGRAYTVGHGGHVAVTDFSINPKTKEMEILSIGRIIPVDKDGKVIKGKASHALSLDTDKGILYWAALDGTITEVDLSAVGLTQDKTPIGKIPAWKTYKATTEWKELGGETDNLHCGSSFSPDKKLLYVSSIGSGAVLVYDTETHTKVDKIPVDKFGCTAQVTPDGKYLYFANMAGGVVDKVDLKTGEIVKKIDTLPYEGTFLHIGEIAPDGRYLWQTAANEFKEGKPYNIPIEGATGIGEGRIIIIDTVTDEVVDSIATPGNPHDVTFTPDGRFAISQNRHLPENPIGSGLVLIDAIEKKALGSHEVCTACHDAIGADTSEFVDPETEVLVNLGLLEHPEKGLSLACGIEIAWSKAGAPGYGG